MTRRAKPHNPPTPEPRLEVPDTPIDPSRLPGILNKRMSQKVAEQMVAELLSAQSADEAMQWVDAPDLFDRPSYIQLLVDTATSVNSATHIKESRNSRAARKNPPLQITQRQNPMGAIAANLAPPEPGPRHTKAHKMAWAAHLELERYRAHCEREHREMYCAAHFYFKDKQQPDPIPGRPEEWGPRSDALRYASALQLGYTPQQASKMVARHSARIKKLAGKLPPNDVALQSALGVLPPPPKTR